MAGQLHHYLPQCFLKGFCNDEGLIWRFDRISGKLAPLSPKVAGAENNLYTLSRNGTISQEVENSLSGVDGPYKDIYSQLLAGIPLRHDQEFQFALFLTLLSLRSPERIREQEMRNSQFTTVVGPGPFEPFSDRASGKSKGARNEVFEFATEFADPVHKDRADAEERNMAIKILLSSAIHHAETLMGLHWRFLMASEERSFLVGDNPVAIIPPANHDVHNSGVGLLTEGASVFIPLSDRLCLEIVNSRGFSVDRVIAGASLVRNLNKCQLMTTERFLFGRSDVLLERITGSVEIGKLNSSIVVTRTANSTSDSNSALLHMFTRSKFPADFALYFENR